MGAGLLLPGVTPAVPSTPPADQFVAPNFERFDGLEPLDNPAGATPLTGSPNRPGGSPAKETFPGTYTPGPLSGVMGVLGGEPLPVADRIHRPAGAYTAARDLTIQFRLGVGQHGPSALGAAQTVQLSDITSAPPVPGDITGIIAGVG